MTGQFRVSGFGFRESGTQAVLVVLGLLVLSGCTANARGDAPAPPRPVGLRWEQFPDIPMPAGWLPLAGEDHVAIAIANGEVRRLRVALQAPSGRADLEPADAMLRYVGSVLGEEGWARVGEGRNADTSQRWSKRSEVLEVSAKRIDGLTTIRWQLVLP